MTPTTITPESKEHWLKLRTQDLTSTDISAWFGASTYTSPYELWHHKKAGTIQEIEETERIMMGNVMEPVIAQLAMKKLNATGGMKVEDYYRIEDLKLGSTPDYIIVVDGKQCLLECKNVDSLQFLKTWIDRGEGDFESTPYVEFQVQHQMLVTGIDTCYIGALVGGNRLLTLKREPIQQVRDSIIEEAEKFWASIEAGVPPEIDWRRDAEFISKMFATFTKGKEIEATKEVERWGRAYEAAGDTEKQARQVKNEMKARIKMAIDGAYRVLGDGWSITNGKSFRFNRKDV